jgi:hypothetical protein
MSLPCWKRETGKGPKPGLIRVSADFLKKGVCVPLWYKTGANTRSVYKVTDFVDRHYLLAEE